MGLVTVSNMSITDKLILNNKHKLVSGSDDYTRLLKKDATKDDDLGKFAAQDLLVQH